MLLLLIVTVVFITKISFQTVSSLNPNVSYEVKLIMTLMFYEWKIINLNQI